MPEQRGEWRYLCSELVEVDYETAPGNFLKLDGNLEEIAPTGAILLLEVSVRRGNALTFRAQNRRLRGVVDSWLYEPPLGYFVTVRFEEGCEWREEDFRPAHILKLPRATRARSQEAS